MPDWSNGMTAVSKTVNGGSIPSSGAKLFDIYVVGIYNKINASLAHLVEQRTCNA